jgi:hypothetical protein
VSVREAVVGSRNPNPLHGSARCKYGVDSMVTEPEISSAEILGDHLWAILDLTIESM